MCCACVCLRFSRRGGDAVHMGQERCLLCFLLLSHLCCHPCCHPRVYPGCKFSSAVDTVDFFFKLLLGLWLLLITR